MKRVASLYLPSWSIDRLRRAGHRHAPSAEADGRAALDALGADAAAERARHCSVPKEGGWRPGARWAHGDPADNPGQVVAAIEALPTHRRPPRRELGRTSEAAQNPFRDGLPRLPGERAATLVPPREPSRGPEVVDDPFRRLSPDDAGPGPRHGRPHMPPLRFPGEDMPAEAGRGAALRGNPRRDSHDGETGHATPPDAAQSLRPPAAASAIRFPQGPHRNDLARSAPAVPTGGQGRSCQEEGAAGMAAPAHEPPLVTVRKAGPRAEVAAVNLAARALGIAPGIAFATARARVPGLEARDDDPAGDAADLRALAGLLARRWAPVVAISDADGLFIDLTGVAHLYGGEERFCRRLVRLLARHGFAARVAVADTAGAAWALARFGGSAAVRTLAPGAQAAALAPLPVDALRLQAPALGLLARLGIDTIGQLAAMPRAPLVRRFGRAITDRLDQATGRASEPLDPVVPPTRIAVERRFAEPIATPGAIAHWLGELMPRLGIELAKAGQGARIVEMVAARVDGVQQRLRLGFARPTRDAAHMLRLTLRRMEEIEPGYGIDAIALRVQRADPLGPEALARALADVPAADIAPLIDALANRIGPGRLWRAAPVESDVPERSSGRVAPLDPPSGGARAPRIDDVRQLDTRGPDHPWHPRWRRPVWLLRRPERIEHVIAELPDSPPRRFTWRGTAHRVVRAEGPERVTGEWWRRSPERLAVRDYFRVEDEKGQRFWLFRRGDGMRAETGDLGWFVHGLGD